MTNLQLLGSNAETLEGNVQFLSDLGVSPEVVRKYASLLGTRPQKKRGVMAWMLRELFDYRDLPEEEKPYALKGLRDFVRDRPYLLERSINYLESERSRLQKAVDRKYK